jgi:hypothetical protein
VDLKGISKGTGIIRNTGQCAVRVKHGQATVEINFNQSPMLTFIGANCQLANHPFFPPFLALFCWDRRITNKF